MRGTAAAFMGATGHRGRALHAIARSPLLVLLGAVLLGSSCARRETAADAGIRTQTLLVGNGAEPADLDPQVINAFVDSHIA